MNRIMSGGQTVKSTNHGCPIFNTLIYGINHNVNMGQLILTTQSGKVCTIHYNGELFIEAGRPNIDQPINFETDIFKWTKLDDSALNVYRRTNRGRVDFKEK
jgi:hypothetical protein